MRLQSDPTIIYGLGAAFDGDLKRHHLTSDGPFQHLHARRVAAVSDLQPGRQCLGRRFDASRGGLAVFCRSG